MLRNLLTERFGLVAHLQSKSMNRFELSVSKSGAKLHRAISHLGPARRGASAPSFDTDGFPKLDPPSEDPQILTFQGRTRMFFPRMSMEDLADELSLKLDKPVVDRTHLDGLYDVVLYWSSDDAGPSLSQALSDQLGLRLELKKGDIQMLVVDHIEKLPTGN
jgi:uncharacterized protein (TIGR03435 family)